jgi:hypothetical protein
MDKYNSNQQMAIYRHNTDIEKNLLAAVIIAYSEKRLDADSILISN